jgi:hypothetical protein
MRLSCAWAGGNEAIGDKARSHPGPPHEAPRERGLLSPTLSSTSVWRRGRWSDAHGFMGSMRDLFRGILSSRKGNGPTARWENPTKSNQIQPAGSEYGPVKPNQTQSNQKDANQGLAGLRTNWERFHGRTGKQTLPEGAGAARMEQDLPGPMERGLTNPARAGMQQRQFAPRPPW